jgi:hypothetical protein
MPSSSTTCSGWSANGNSSLHLSSTQSAILKSASAGGTCAIPRDVQLDAGATLVLCPGVYVFNSGSNLTMNGSSILLAPPSTTTTPAISAACVGDLTGGVTIVFANSAGNPGAPTIGGSATVNITAPTTGATAGIAVFQQRTTCTGNGNGNTGCSGLLQNGGTQNITGAIYFPNNAISYAGGSSTGSQ